MKKKFWIVNRINPTKAEILIYGYINPWDVSSIDFVIELEQLCASFSYIKIRINSGGGSIFEGIAMYNAIMAKRKEGIRIDTQCDGIAGSMAFVLFQSGEKRFISKFGRTMVHRASGWAEGDYDDLRLQADLIESAQGDVVKIISGKTGLLEDEVKTKYMQKGVDNWFNSKDSIKNKFADEEYDGEQVSVPDNVTNEKEVYNIFDQCLNKTQTMNLKEIAKKLGLPETATEAEVLAAIDKQNEQLTSARNQAEQSAKARAKALVDSAINNKVLTEADREQYEQQAVANYDFVANAISKLTPAKRPTDVLNRTDIGKANNIQQPKVGEENKTEWENLVSQGHEAVEDCKKNDFARYKQMWEAHYGVQFPEREY